MFYDHHIHTHEHTTTKIEVSLQTIDRISLHWGGMRRKKKYREWIGLLRAVFGLVGIRCLEVLELGAV